MNRAINLEEHKKIMLEMMQAFHTFCEKNNLVYYLDAGTLLGAIRNKGFIPWDNDMDICMLREDYDRLFKLLRETNGYFGEYYCVKNDKDSPNMCSKIYDMRTVLIEYPQTIKYISHVYIDIFPKDFFEDINPKTYKLCKKCRKLSIRNWVTNYTIKKYIASKNVIKKIVGLSLFPLFGKNDYYKRKQNKIILKHNKNINDKVYVTTLIHGEYNNISRFENFKERILVEFDNYLFYAPKGYDNYLADLYYYDYMIPPLKNGRMIHNIEVYWNE